MYPAQSWQQQRNIMRPITTSLPGGAVILRARSHDKYGTTGSHPHHLRHFSQPTGAKLYVSTHERCTLTTQNIFETIYAPSAPYSKLEFFENRFNMPQATFATADFHPHKLFPDSHAYKPEGWLDNPKGPDGAKSLSRYMVAFERGSRMCLGMPMAYAEIYITLTTLMRWFNFSIFETGSENVDFWQDFVTPQPKPGSLGVKVLVD